MLQKKTFNPFNFPPSKEDFQQKEKAVKTTTTTFMSFCLTGEKKIIQFFQSESVLLLLFVSFVLLQFRYQSRYVRFFFF